MKKKLCWILALLLGATLMLTACNEWKNYSRDYHDGTFAIRNFTENNFFTEKSEIEITFAEPKEVTDGIIAEVNHSAYFIFRELKTEVVEVTYNHTVERTDEYDVTMKDGSQFYLTLYAYDWSDKILVMGTDIYFERVEKTPETPETDPYPEISHEIKLAYLKTHTKDAMGKELTEDDIGLSYYGAFNDTYVLMIYGGVYIVGTMMTTVHVGGVIFEFADTQVFDVYHDGEFYTLQEAYDAGLLGSIELLQVQEKHKTEHPSLYARLDRITSEIVSAYAAMREIPESKVMQPEFYGIFQDTYVIMISARGDMFAAAEFTMTVDGVTFMFGDSLKFSVYHDGEFYSLQDAFYNGYLTHDDLLSVQRNHKFSYEHQKELDTQN